MSRLQGILAAGGLTGIVLASTLALGGGLINPQTPAPENTDTAEVTEAPMATPTITPTPQVIVIHRPAALPTQDEAYKAQIEAANQTIIQLQQQLADQQAANAGGGGNGGGNDDSHEREEHEDGDD